MPGVLGDMVARKILGHAGRVGQHNFKGPRSVVAVAEIAGVGAGPRADAG